MNFKKYILALIMASLTWGGALAQQRFQFTQYMLNNFLLNPAVAGAYDYIDVRAGFRNQWTGFEDAPRSFFLSGHFSPRIFKRDKAELVLPTIGTIDYHLGKGTKASSLSSAFGGLFVYDQTGPISRIMFSLSYALHFPISDKLKASLGLQGGGIQYRLNNDELVPDPINGGLDPAVGTGVSTSLLPDLGAGAFVYSDKLYVGFSMSQLLGSELSYSDVEIGPQNKLLLHYFLTGGYRFALGTGKWSFIPSVLVKFLEASPASVDFNARLAVDLNDINHLWFGMSYRYDDALAGMLGLSINRLLDLNYSFDYTTTKLNNFNSGTHEITLGLRIPGRLIESYPHRLF